MLELARRREGDGRPRRPAHRLRRGDDSPARARDGREITDAYPDGDLLVLGLLKGSFIFLGDLVRQIQRPIQVDFLVAASYGNATVSSGDVRLVYDPETRLDGKHILLVEDIIDTRAHAEPAGRAAGDAQPAEPGACARCCTSTSRRT